MASLMQIAKEQAENLRAGAVWVIVWKTGRSWNAEAVSLDKSYTWKSAEDKTRAQEILEKNPQAVMLSGGVCGCLSEKSTAKEIAEEIRWQYENGFHLLRKAVQAIAEPEPAETEPDRETVPEQINAAPWTEHIKRMEKAFAELAERWAKWRESMKDQFPGLFPEEDSSNASAIAPDNEQSPRLVNVSALCIDAHGKVWQAFDCNNRARAPPKCAAEMERR